MSDPRQTNLADILVNYCVKARPKQWVAVVGNIIAEPLVNDIQEKIVQAGGYPAALFFSETLDETLMRLASEEQLQWVSPVWDTVYNKADAIISVWSSRNLKALNSIPAEKSRIQQSVMQPLMQIFSQRMASGSLKWVGTQYPCQSYAQEAEMSLREYEDFVYAATLADQPDAVSAWEKVKQHQQQHISYLHGKKSIHIRSPHADLRLSIDGRDFINDGGEVNMPGGEIYTSPVEDSANGWIEFNYPAIEHGREVSGIRLEFADGRVTRATSDRNEDFLLEMLEMDAGARILGEFAIG
ncbi:MAG: aminopeptidase, partial [Anaerolineaceae bacterium]